MSTNVASCVFCLFLLVSLVSSARIRKHGANSTDVVSSDSTAFNCRDMCVSCNDGSTVFFGRNSNWWKLAPSIALGGVGIAAASTGVGLVGVGVAGAAGGMLGAGAVDKTGKETHTHWTGNLPTTGAFCERVDVIKHSVNQQPEVWMSSAETKLGRVQNNNLKPYDAQGGARNDFAYAMSDMESYKHGCKIVKAAGLTGSWSQLKSVFQEECKSEVAKGAMTCAGHSKLCGGGGVRGILDTTDYTQCMDTAGVSGAALALSSNSMRCLAEN